MEGAIPWQSRAESCFPGLEASSKPGSSQIRAPDLLAPVWSCAAPSPPFLSSDGFSPDGNFLFTFTLDSFANTLLSGLRMFMLHMRHMGH